MLNVNCALQSVQNGPSSNGMLLRFNYFFPWDCVLKVSLKQMFTRHGMAYPLGSSDACTETAVNL